MTVECPAAEFRDTLAACPSLISLAVNTGRTRSLTAMFTSQPCWDPGSHCMDSLQSMFDRPLSSSSLSLSLGQMSGIYHLGTTEKQHMCSHRSCAADAIRELNQPKAGSSMQKELGPQPSQQCQHQGSRKVGRRAGRREELTPGQTPVRRIQLQHHIPSQAGAEEMLWAWWLV